MFIKFTENVRYSENGFDVKKGEKGELRDVAHSAACSLVRKGKAYNMEGATDNEQLDEVMSDISAIMCHIDHRQSELHSKIDELYRLTRVSGSDVVMPAPNPAMKGFSVQRVLRDGI